jgi:23S rRNA (cytidine1920-2'-O)/16S rRNA (cytidine1409-2'-O)-methyltransferase
VSRRLRLDAEMVRRGLVTSRTDAARAIDDHRVLVNGTVADKSARLVSAADPIVITGAAPRFVSRGGEKLDHALETFGLDVSGCFVLDAGASTGGFSDCVLQRGARHVVALDVGHGQLHPKIRDHPDVTVMERYNVRSLTPDTLAEAPDVVVADLSFISLTKVVPVLAHVAAPGARLVLLVKPQFEAGRQEVGRGHGVITDPAIHERVRLEVGACLVASGLVVEGWCDSPITGAEGNREFLVHASVPVDRADAASADEVPPA